MHSGHAHIRAGGAGGLSSKTALPPSSAGGAGVGERDVMKKLDLSDYLTQVVVAFFAIAACKLIARQFDEPNKGLGTSAEGRASPPGVGGADSRQKEIKTQNRIHAGLVDQCRKGHLPTEDWATLANRLGLKIEMLQKEVAVVVSNTKVHKDDDHRNTSLAYNKTLRL